jgi:hypothetical protein
MNEFAPYLKMNGCFIVQNVSTQIKTINIFQYPINYGRTRDLLQIPGVAESDIRASLLKGELNHKLRAQDITVICSDIDLLQFNNEQKNFLMRAGIVNGLSAGGTGGITEQDHETLRQLIHFIDEGPGDGFISGAYKVILGQPFPTSITWYIDNTQAKKIIEKLITYNGTNLPISITWNVYDLDGISIKHSLTDAITYTGTAFESTRVRTIL